MAWINGFARVHGLRVHTRWSKVWEYPWTWKYLSGLSFPDLRILDIGSEISPMPWFFASLGAKVTMVESDPCHEEKWRSLRERHGFDVDWLIVRGAELPLASETFDLVTSYSVIEHIDDKEVAVEEAIRVVKPGGILCFTFDVCERERGMIFPSWNGNALDMASFDRLIWRRADLEPFSPEVCWNEEDIRPFLEWHLRAAPHHNYVVGAAILSKKKIQSQSRSKAADSVHVHSLDTGLGAGNTGDDAMFEAAFENLPPRFDLCAEVHSMARTKVLPQSAKYLLAGDKPAVEKSLRESRMVFLMGGTPIMDAWGVDWPLQANAAKLDLCRKLGISVHAVGIGVDRLITPKGERIFRESYSDIVSWTVRSSRCRQALLDMGIREESILVGADWAWLLPCNINAEWAGRWLSLSGTAEGKPKMGVNLVNEIWQGDPERKKAWATLLDRFIERYDVEVFFFCNESRPGEYYDRAAAREVRALMHHPSILLPDRYYLPSEILSLLSRMDITISQRYHFTLLSILADVFPISIQRGQKMKALNEDLGLPFVGDMDHFDPDQVEQEVRIVLGDPESKLKPIRLSAEQLKKRAAGNVSLVG
jgi:polysaccharide pyruvyl transferase WcaK-like protein